MVPQITTPPTVIDRRASVSEMLDELVQLLRAWAGDVRPDREAAGRYMACRTALLGAKVPVPGFLIQCGSIYKFSEFITLYHPQLPARLAFLDAMMEECRPMPSGVRARDIFQDFEH